MAIVGLGLSGVAAARLCLARGARVTAMDEAPLAELGSPARELALAGVVLRTGPLVEAELCQADIVVVSPGVPRRPALAAAERAGAEVIAELELGARFLSAPLILVGGTNGKSTVTALVHRMLVEDGRRAFVGGNFGAPLCDAVGGSWDALVVEISSFQAERVPTLHARVGALLNITEDHLDRYDDFADYARAKGNPFARMTAQDVAVIPAGDALCAAQAGRGAARRITFGVAADGADVALDSGAIVDGVRGLSYRLQGLRLRGQHNLYNACAAAAVAGAMGGAAEAIERALAGFEPLAHRTVLVAEMDGVAYYDDSKGTNVGATVAALCGLREARAVLIAGGRDKQGSYGPLVAALRRRGRALVAIGEAAERIAAAAAGVLPVARAGSMSEAVAQARRLAEPGDAVLLSPACSSFDMFRNYRERGEAFAAAVQAARGGQG
ncbi:MAG: UDP-N-acetylmuramoyl-L-alanine--D-glutamate ligase [Deltaproteobacteria bacterium]|nr:UDP-N-acetylmuramoyl-L-alanine--D-glutamate ligase [Deltaproteobacteria bacterium]